MNRHLTMLAGKGVHCEGHFLAHSSSVLLFQSGKYMQSWAWNEKVENVFWETQNWHGTIVGTVGDLSQRASFERPASQKGVESLTLKFYFHITA